MIVKPLQGEIAWKVQEQMIDKYFNVIESMTVLSPQLQVLINMELKQKQIEEDLAITKQETAAARQEIEDIREVMIVYPDEDWRKYTNRLLANICRKQKDYRKPKEFVYKALEERAHCQLSIRLNNLKSRSISKGKAPSKVNRLNMLDVLEEEPRLKEIYISIVKEMAIKNDVNVV